MVFGPFGFLGFWVFGLEMLRDFKGLLYPVDIVVKSNLEAVGSRELVGVRGFFGGGWVVGGSAYAKSYGG